MEKEKNTLKVGSLHSKVRKKESLQSKGRTLEEIEKRKRHKLYAGSLHSKGRSVEELKWCFKFL